MCGCEWRLVVRRLERGCCGGVGTIEEAAAAEAAGDEEDDRLWSFECSGRLGEE
jgi:hypothetical protein